MALIDKRVKISIFDNIDTVVEPIVDKRPRVAKVGILDYILSATKEIGSWAKELESWTNSHAVIAKAKADYYSSSEGKKTLEEVVKIEMEEWIREQEESIREKREELGLAKPTIVDKSVRKPKSGLPTRKQYSLRELPCLLEARRSNAIQKPTITRTKSFSYRVETALNNVLFCVTKEDNTITIRPEGFSKHTISGTMDFIRGLKDGVTEATKNLNESVVLYMLDEFIESEKTKDFYRNAWKPFFLMLEYDLEPTQQISYDSCIWCKSEVYYPHDSTGPHIQVFDGYCPTCNKELLSIEIE
jgi:hypothetical protein